MSVLRDNWNTAIIELKESLNLIGWLPHEIVYEIQNALVHLILAIRSTNGDDRRKEWKRAIAHLRRAHLDALKISLFKIYQKLKDEISDTQTCEKFIQFQKNFSRARLRELQTLGNWGIHNYYRQIVKQYTSQPASNSFKVPESAQGATSKNYSLIDEHLKLLWEWAQLETIQTSLLGQKIYDSSYNMIEAYLKWDNFDEAIKDFIIILKINLVIIILQNDCDNNFKLLLSEVGNGKQFLENLDILKATSSSQSFEPDPQLFNKLKNNIDQIFPCVLTYLQVSIIDISQIG